MADIFAEVDEAMKRERLEKLWAQHGKWLIAAIVAIILGTAGFSGWKSWNTNVQTHQTSLLLQAMESDNPAQALEKISGDIRPGLRGIALLSAGGTLITDKNEDRAYAVFRKAAQDTSIPAEFRDLAILMSVRLGARQDTEGKSSTEFLSQLETILANDKSPWRYHAMLETAVILAHISQDYKAAQEHLNVILEAPNLPASLYSKARALKHIYTLKNSDKNPNKNSKTKNANTGGEG